MSTPSSASATSRFRLEIWRIVTWLVLLLAIFGIFVYSMETWRVAAMLRAHAGSSPRSLQAMLAWDIVYLVVACVTVSAAAGTLWRRRWARFVLRVLAALLAVWMLVTAIQLAAQWSAIDDHLTMLSPQTMQDQINLVLTERKQGVRMIAIILKAVGVPVLAWLAWRLGVPAVREQFARK